MVEHEGESIEKLPFFKAASMLVVRRDNVIELS
jgi:hypothetical protein